MTKATKRKASVVIPDVALDSVSHDPAMPVPPDATRSPTKKTRLAMMLSDPDGITMAALTESLGWQAHTVRAALTGLRKSGREIERSTDGTGATRCRLLDSGV